ncbi:hypothetical protein H9650_00970 [Psychrobacillus sp. Sa2BUA9]|uniref:Uncharacterized protein n=1 Tax=Psychrobacillus faecigallinarum TaxID=2762235 RepID=A0ABR8R4F8_9BACI|nr:hypothetical protein [Psychrobacillus faecigallinarum]MBD7942669.1 hypothetical protein [Psychrobacillus faecigallinarum]
MTTIILTVLFLLQIISFYFIALLNMKISKYKGMEDKQEQMIKEIENSFSAYIAEIKDENDRLLHELKEQNNYSSEKKEVISIAKKEISSASNEESQSLIISRPLVSKQKAASSYVQSSNLPEKEIPITLKEKVLYYSEEGKNPTEIAKLLQIGKTEVELFLKFQD